MLLFKVCAVSVAMVLSQQQAPPQVEHLTLAAHRVPAVDIFRVDPVIAPPASGPSGWAIFGWVMLGLATAATVAGGITVGLVGSTLNHASSF